MTQSWCRNCARCGGQRRSGVGDGRPRTRRHCSSSVVNATQNERDVIYAAFYGDLTYRQVAERFGIPEGTIKSQIRRTMLKLRTQLADAG